MVQRKGAITVAMRSLQSQSRETTRVEPFPEAFVVFAGNPQLSDRLFDLKLPVDNDADHHIVGRVFNEAASPTGEVAITFKCPQERVCVQEVTAHLRRIDLLRRICSSSAVSMCSVRSSSGSSKSGATEVTRPLPHPSLRLDFFE